ncbi:iron-siderophore ABC transporter substrate-binding protein [Marinobacter qingdaonensis]|uniref:Iron-siderophore ABC transporter substrate-binding protein n=1 Tax=Marinobacter qingdaonensis TaxID=3108486 RepID=A0ABU5NWZ4_9GAMM|nr:iron-siderophore ABC transporter substrate-binding protein [Marinobacter sp. ASW11-75]MEA1080329.1 iron-siderophore ABC transporter substrate-binding protein [Marinobacter sp. ASW11-75]
MSLPPSSGAPLRRRVTAVLCALLCLPTLLPAVGSAAPAQARVIHHAQGSTTLAGSPQRVVTLFQGANDTAVALGVTPVGVVDAWAQGANYDYLDAALAGVPHVGLETQPSMEAIAMLEPDLIIASKRRHERIYPQLSRIAPTVSVDTVFDVEETLAVMGQALNREARAEALWQQWQRRLAEVRGQLQASLGDRWPLSVTLLNVRADHVRIYLGGSYAGTVLDQLGFRRPAAHPSDQWVLKLTTKESIPIIDADRIFVFMEDSPAVRDNYQAWTGHPLWQNLQAETNGAVYPVDAVAWNLAGGLISAHRMLDQVAHHFGLEPSP